MIPLQIALTALCLLSALWLVVLLVRDRTPDRLLLNLLAVLEVGLIVHLVLGIVHVTSDAPAGVSDVGVHRLPDRRHPVRPGRAWCGRRGRRAAAAPAYCWSRCCWCPFMFVRLADIWAGGG